MDLERWIEADWQRIEETLEILEEPATARAMAEAMLARLGLIPEGRGYTHTFRPPEAPEVVTAIPAMAVVTGGEGVDALTALSRAREGYLSAGPVVDPDRAYVTQARWEELVRHPRVEAIAHPEIRLGAYELTLFGMRVRVSSALPEGTFIVAGGLGDLRVSVGPEGRVEADTDHPGGLILGAEVSVPIRDDVIERHYREHLGRTDCACLDFAPEPEAPEPMLTPEASYTWSRTKHRTQAEDYDGEATFATESMSDLLDRMDEEIAAFEKG